MVKKGSLTKQEVFYIEQNPEKKTIHELAKELDRSPKLVAKHYVQPVMTPIEESVATPTATTTTTHAESPMFQLMGRKQRSGKNVATVMTKAASELADATRPSRIANKKMQSAIHKPMG